MTKFASPSFTVAMGSSDEERARFCALKGHAARDSKGRCLCCGAPLNAADILGAAMEAEESRE